MATTEIREFAAQARSIESAARVELSTLLGESVPLLTSRVRLAQKVAVDCRRDGMLVHEYRKAADAAPPWYKSLGQREQKRFSTAATGLADDYRCLTTELLTRLVAA